jgi:hypothetical protein
MTGQYTFDDDGKVYVAPTRLSETAEAWEPRPKQLGLTEWGTDADKLAQWTLNANDELTDEEMP